MAGDGENSADARMRLAIELKVIRDLSGLSGRDLAARLKISQSKISRLEAGTTLPSVQELTGWVETAGAQEQLPTLLSWLEDILRTEAEDQYSGFEDRQSLQEAEREATTAICRSRIFQPIMVPGLLQTADYLRRSLTTLKTIMPQINVPLAVTERINRQPALYEEDKRFEFLIGEAALRWRPGPPNLLLSQFDRIATISTLPNVTIGIIPLLAMYEKQWAAQWQMARFGDDARTILTRLSAEMRALGS